MNNALVADAQHILSVLRTLKDHPASRLAEAHVPGAEGLQIIIAAAEDQAAELVRRLMHDRAEIDAALAPLTEIEESP